MKILKRLVVGSIIALLATSCHSQVIGQNPMAVGKVKWGRDYATATKLSRETGKPIFLLFQEVPGCSGCQQFGKDVLSNPKIVTAIEQNFIPLLIHNNDFGADAGVLKRFGEPAFNFQVVRFINADGQDLILRKDHVWEAPELMERIQAALTKTKLAMPVSPKIPAATQASQRVAFSQYCFWQGEATLGAIDGVLRTEAGFIGGNEVTLVDYNPTQITLKNLTAQAKAAGVATGTYTDLKGYRKAPDSDQKRQLQGTQYAHKSLTPEQATKVNAFIRSQPEKAEQALRNR
jgi:Thioredoxin-like